MLPVQMCCRAAVGGHVYEKTEEFCRLYGEDRLVAILEAADELGRQCKTSGTVDDIHIIDIQRQDAINYTVTGSFGDDVYFDIDNGNNAGTVVAGFGDDAKLREKGCYIRVLDIGSKLGLGTLPHRTLMLDLYVSWVRGQGSVDFMQAEHGYAYDAHFAPGGKTTAYYQTYAARHGLSLGGGWRGESEPAVPYEWVETRNAAIRKFKADTPEYAEAQAAYAEMLARWLAFEQRHNAAGVAARNAVEWREWAPYFAEGLTSTLILERHRVLDAEVLKALAS